MKAHQTTIGKQQEWITPKYILDALGPFDLDPCAAVAQPWPTAHVQYTEQGLESDWFGRVWCNPPFHRFRRGLWMAKMAEHNNGIMLVPAACETQMFQKYVFRVAHSILMLSRRPHFHYIDGTRASANSGCTICLVAYGANNTDSLLCSGLGFTLKLIA